MKQKKHKKSQWTDSKTDDRERQKIAGNKSYRVVKQYLD